MAKRIKKDNHALYSMNYILVQSTNCGEKLFNNQDYIDSLKDLISNINKTFEVKEINMECGENYFTLIFSAKPSTHISEFVNAIKTHTSRELKRKFPILVSLIKDKFWAPTYFIATSGNTTIDDKKEYLDSQSIIKTTKTRSNSHDRFRKPSIA